ncbi:hypothetical protein JCM21714_3677 [Gracilibacillus boraciitolerans JCM 21714]|uniref:DUF5085 domain-containing protein n=1 Tax=Gracilibacillus boraciitolerans JCM 21714 TaxID=1298598 RepID=W4VMB1_9BACI|nr:hypothetical protein [Gracilibacillus boraciitolerans]GAE94515.1 hypothetical protein JCM21714_3677 [Gracilibacillus boraciitolerans JCM 21714]
MKIENRSLIFENVITYQTTQLRKDWQEGFYKMEEIMLAEGIYQSGPTFFSVEPERGEAKYGDFTYYLPINNPVQFTEESEFGFKERFHISEAFVLRQADEAKDFHVALEKIQQHAEEKDIAIEDTFYCVLLEVFDDYMINLYVPLKTEGEA